MGVMACTVVAMGTVVTAPTEHVGPGLAEQAEEPASVHVGSGLDAGPQLEEQWDSNTASAIGMYLSNWTPPEQNICQCIPG